MNKSHIAVDIGASSGRLILGTLIEDKLALKEVHRFKNKMTYNKGHYTWDVENLFSNILEGLKKIRESGQDPVSIGVDTWGVDYALIDAIGDRVAPVYAYRDHRTDGTMEEVFNFLSPEEIYEKTGIQFMQFNTLFQLYEHVKEMPMDFKGARGLLLVPDYLHYRLTGKVGVEYTNATTTQLINVHTCEWDLSLLEALGLDAKLMPSIIKPGTSLGRLRHDLAEETGIHSLEVIAPATHDTGSAIVSIPALDDEFCYISSGTWSLMGLESKTPVTGQVARAYNLTNEGGVMGTYRVLKNIMGLWLIQEVQRIHDNKYSFDDYVKMAKTCQPFRSIIHPNDPRFLNPEDMVVAIQDYCRETDQEVPISPGQVARCIFESLALSYKQTLGELGEVSTHPIKRIHIIGGGCQNKFLNQLTADITGLKVVAGPIEATAIGNLAMQLVANNRDMTLREVRALIMRSFDIETYDPHFTERDIQPIYEAYRRYQDAIQIR